MSLPPSACGPGEQGRGELACVMASPGLQQSALQLLGRERECAVIDRVLAEAGDGAGGALVVRGEAGIGKSALLDYARQRAAPMAVLSAAGVEADGARAALRNSDFSERCKKPPAPDARSNAPSRSPARRTFWASSSTRPVSSAMNDVYGVRIP